VVAPDWRLAMLQGSPFLTAWVTRELPIKQMLPKLCMHVHRCHVGPHWTAGGVGDRLPSAKLGDRRNP